MRCAELCIELDSRLEVLCLMVTFTNGEVNCPVLCRLRKSMLIALAWEILVQESPVNYIIYSTF